MKISPTLKCLVLLLIYSVHLAGLAPQIYTESDPDAFIENCINVINGDYCESATDLVIAGPDALILQRYYSTKDIITGAQDGAWRMLPQRFLVISKDVSGRTANVRNEQFEWQGQSIKRPQSTIWGG